MKAKQAKATMAQIAELTGLPESSVRRHGREGRFDMDDFWTVVEYVYVYVKVNEFEAMKPKPIKWQIDGGKK